MIFSICPSLLKDPSTFLTYIGLSSFFNLKLCFLVNLELITNLIAPLSNNASTVIPFCVSILSSLIFTVTSLNVLASTFLTSFLDSGTSAFIPLANTLYLFGEPSWGALGSLLLLNYSKCSWSPQFFHLHILLSYSPPLFPSVLDSYNDGPCAQNLHTHNNSSLNQSPLHRGLI